MTSASRPRTFASRKSFRAWLERHHADRDELILRCYKVGAPRSGIGYREALDEALCFGWIDGVRHAFDANSFTVRFTPRKTRSYWSAVNTRRYKELESEGRIAPPGRAAFRARANQKEARRYSFESRQQALGPAFAKRLRANRRAWTFYKSQPPWYRRTSAFWVMSAKKEETRERRFATLLRDSAAGRSIKPLTRPGASRKRLKK